MYNEPRQIRPRVPPPRERGLFIEKQASVVARSPSRAPRAAICFRAAWPPPQPQQPQQLRQHSESRVERFFTAAAADASAFQRGQERRGQAGAGDCVPDHQPASAAMPRGTADRPDARLLGGHGERLPPGPGSQLHRGQVPGAGSGAPTGRKSVRNPPKLPREDRARAVSIPISVSLHRLRNQFLAAPPRLTTRPTTLESRWPCRTGAPGGGGSRCRLPRRDWRRSRRPCGARRIRCGERAESDCVSAWQFVSARGQALRAAERGLAVQLRAQGGKDRRRGGARRSVRNPHDLGRRRFTSARRGAGVPRA